MRSTSRRRSTVERRSATGLARAGGSVRAGDTTQTRRLDVVAGNVEVPEGHGICPECYRLVRLRSNGRLFSHHYCPGTGAFPRGT